MLLFLSMHSCISCKSSDETGEKFIIITALDRTKGQNHFLLISESKQLIDSNLLKLPFPDLHFFFHIEKNGEIIKKIQELIINETNGKMLKKTDQKFVVVFNTNASDQDIFQISQDQLFRVISTIKLSANSKLHSNIINKWELKLKSQGHIQ